METIENIGLTIPGNWSFEIRRISPVKSTGFHEIKNVRFCVMIKYRSFFRKTNHKIIFAFGTMKATRNIHHG